MSDERFVITISRQFASLGRTIGKNMAKELGIGFYDRDIVEETARRMNLPVPEVSMAEEKAGSIFENRKYPLGMGLVSMKQEIFHVQSNIIRDLAKKESCIIVGRCADVLLKDYKNVFNIYIYAPYQARLRNCVESLEMDEKTAKNMIREVDRARELYRLRYCDGVKEVFDHRDFMIDSSRFGTEKTAQILCKVVRTALC
ncbi:MAG: cytidylate kinase-like family protein [Lachnospiraceae bacterium]|nr:cytidylate kinase-like family protein [Lachnospiraceae bacterium]